MRRIGFRSRLADKCVTFDGRVVIVTGAGRGLGRCYAEELAARGARVVVNDLEAEKDGSGRDGSLAETVAREIRRDGGEAVASTASIITAEGAEAVVSAGLEAFGRLDGLVNNAGIGPGGSLDARGADDLVKQLNVHVLGSFHMCRAVWPHFSALGGGRIIVTASAAFLGGTSTGATSVLTYGTAKGGMIGLTKNLSVLGGELNIYTNLVAPLANTRMARASGYKNGDPARVAALVVYLLHPSCTVNGELLSAGMGRVARLVVSETRGYSRSDLSPENVRDNWEAIVNDEYTTTVEEVRGYMENFTQLAHGSPSHLCNSTKGP
jgi:NAD(P)-dependent dehydrogenase (short-subunit alcohol dehydrogenase family)